MLSIARSSALDDDTRQASLEFLTLLIENSPNMIRALPPTVLLAPLLHILFSILVAIDADPGHAWEREETEPDEAGYVERYWVSVSSGLLAAAERECDGAVVYRMAALTVSYDGVDAEDFTLPNGTVLYEPAVAATKEISENG